ncbi:MAG: ArsR family transcriptional regulator [Actinobacteria bacterium]|nr:MAG: ArsR family transcriptional regulator [Actinomycetota bacterium]
MFGRLPCACERAPAAVRAEVRSGAGAASPAGSVTARIPSPPLTSAPPPISPRFRKVRRSTCLCSFGSMGPMRALMVRPAALVTLGFLAPAPAAAAAPICTPASLNESSLQAGSVTVSPLPGSRDASPETQISFLGVPARALAHVSVIGSRTGRHAGRVLAYSQGDGASFVPARRFAEGERVQVRASIRGSGTRRTLRDRFAVAVRDPISSTPERVHRGRGGEVQGFRSRPDLHPPTVAVSAGAAGTAPGDIFAAPYGGPGQAGPMILDPGGGLIWFRGLPAKKSASNLRVQLYGGKPVLTWWQGVISVHGFGVGEDVIADQTYSAVAHVRAGNGLQADLHEFLLEPDGTALITAYHPIRCNLSAVGGSREGAVTDGVLQRIDVRTGLVMFQWSGLDHVGLAESYELARKSTPSSPFDFLHLNSVNLDADNSLLISARNTWAVYDLDARSGQISWRLGGKHSSFRMAPATRTAWQHDPRELNDGSISIFDNGASPAVKRQSRGIVVRVDASRGTATLVSQLTHSPPLLADSQGNLQVLEDGDEFIGWGEVGEFSEFDPTGQLLFDGHFPSSTESYRDFRFAWSATPAHAPAFTVVAAANGGATVFASWNGATDVANWRVLAGPSPGGLSVVAQAQRSGFETAIALPAQAPGPVMTVQAIDRAGAVTGTAAPRRVTFGG